jgi:hypothetical protein
MSYKYLTMDFTKLVLEELIDYDNLTFKLVSIAWMDGRTGSLYHDKVNDDDREVFCLKDSKGGTWWAEALQPNMRFNETPKEQNYRVIQEPSWYKREKGGYKRGVERNDLRKKLIYDIIPKAVEQLRLKQSLTPDTQNTFGDLIDEL